MRELTLALLGLMGCAGAEPDADDPAVDPTELRLVLANVSSTGALVPDSTGTPQDHLLAPGVLVVHDPSWTLFELGELATYAGLEAVAEDGDNRPLLDALAADGDVREALSFSAKDANYDDAPMLPGDDAGRTISVGPDDRVTVIAMYGESNDIVVATAPGGVVLVQADGTPLLGDASAELGWYDMGTEVDQEPGTGSDQPMRQAAPGAGTAQSAPVQVVEGTDAGGFPWPAVERVVSLTVDPAP